MSVLTKAPLFDLTDVSLPDLLAAAEQIGVIQVVGHGVPAEVIEEFHRQIGEVLALPPEEKAALTSPTGHPYRGWRQWPDDFGRLELERYNIAQFDDAADARAAGLTPEQAALYDHVNVWPPQAPGLRAASRAYHDALVGVARKIIGLYEQALGLPAGRFPFGEGPPYTYLVVNDYPTWTDTDEGGDEDKLLLLEHSDGAALTVLHQEGDYAGLQAQLADGSWTSVPIVPGALQVFTGQLLATWTDGRLRPGRHRVVAGGTVTRRSSALFVRPSLDTVVEPLDEFVGPDGPEYEPVSVWEQASRRVEEYLEVFGRPEQIAAYREGRPYVAEVIA